MLPPRTAVLLWTVRPMSPRSVGRYDFMRARTAHFLSCSRRREWQFLPIVSPRMSTSDHRGVPVPTCRFCGAALTDTVVDLGMSPLCESYLRPNQLNSMEPFYPL